jgi:hypothetical protein
MDICTHYDRADFDFLLLIVWTMQKELLIKMLFWKLDDDPSLVLRQFALIEQSLFASQAYLNEFGDIKNPELSIPSLMTSTRRLLTISCKRISGYFFKKAGKILGNEGIDIALRVRSKLDDDPSLVLRQFALIEQSLFASQAYH